MCHIGYARYLASICFKIMKCIYIIPAIIPAAGLFGLVERLDRKLGALAVAV